MAGRGSLSAAGRETDSEAGGALAPSFIRMAPDPKPSRPPLSPSSTETSTGFSNPQGAQLPGRNGVETSVSTAALDRGMLMAATTPQASAAAEGSDSDAEIMLRAKAGDQSAFDYLVQKYRRPIVSFMYRMARNTAAAA